LIATATTSSKSAKAYDCLSATRRSRGPTEARAALTPRRL
jgi:hypothetical protein